MSPPVAGELHGELHRQAFGARLVPALAVVVAAGYLPSTSPGRQALLAWLVALVVIPFDAVLFLLARRRRLWAANLVGLLGELLLVLVFWILFPVVAPAALLAVVLVVAFYAYVGGRPLGLAAAGGGFAVAAIALATTTSDAPPGLTWAVFAFVVIGIVALVDRATLVQRRAVAELTQLRDKGDAILEHVADGVVVTDGRGHLTQLNDAAARLFASPGAAVGSRCGDVLGLHIDARQLDCTGACALLAEPVAAEPHLGVEVWREGDDGRRQPLLANVSPILDGAGNVVEIVHSLRDVSRLKQAEEAKTLFLATASHELKTPLTVIQGFAQALLLGRSTDETENLAALKAIERRARELAKIVDRLLLSSRIEAGRLDLVMRPVALGPLLADRVEELSAATGRSVELDLALDLPTVMGDEAAVVTVVDHLLDNALKYSADGSPVTVSATTDGERVEIRVRDRGIGMDAEQAARCFDKFWQADSSDDRRFGGTGIGLYIVRSIVEGLGGSVRADSVRGEGTTFVVSLVRAQEQAPSDTVDSVILEVMRQVGVTRAEAP